MNTFDFNHKKDINSDGEGIYKHPNYPQYHFHKSSFKKEWLDQYVKDVKTIVDIGALDGGDALRLSTFYPDATVYSIEACPHNFGIIKNKLSEEKNIKIFNVAISDKNGQISIYRQKVRYNYGTDGSEDMFMGSIYDLNDSFKEQANFYYDAGKIEVDCLTFDKFCADNKIENVDFAHIDVEGGGLELLTGMNEFLPKVIFIEKENQPLFKEKLTGDDRLLNIFNEKNYTLVIDLANDFFFVRNY